MIKIFNFYTRHGQKDTSNQLKFFRGFYASNVQKIRAINKKFGGFYAIILALQVTLI